MSKRPFAEYHPPVRYTELRTIKDVMVPMRDGTELCIDINLPVGEGPFPALLSFGLHNKDLLDTDYSASMPPQPSWSHFWFGNIESGDTKFFCTRGYAHVTAQARGAGTSGPVSRAAASRAKRVSCRRSSSSGLPAAREAEKTCRQTMAAAATGTKPRPSVRSSSSRGASPQLRFP